jgi:hypothetical protein
MDSKEVSYRAVFYSLIAIVLLLIAIKLFDHKKEPVTLYPLKENVSK